MRSIRKIRIDRQSDGYRHGEAGEKDVLELRLHAM
jgi:hypothetical protein